MPSEPTRVDFKELIPEVRQRINEIYESDPVKYDKVDIDKLAQDDWSALRYIKWNRGDIDQSVKQLEECLRWRHEFGVNSEGDVAKEFVKAGAVFASGVDNSDRPLLYMRVKVYKKIPQLVAIFRQFVVGVINKVDIKAGAKGYALVFDLSGVGFSNVDMDFLQFLINTMKNYFPYGLRYVIVYNFPRLLRPLWSVAKLWIGAQEKIIKFVSGDEIRELVPVEQLPLYLGGCAHIDFTGAPEGCKSVKELAPKYGFTDAEVEKYMKMFEPHIKEAQRLVVGDK